MSQMNPEISTPTANNAPPFVNQKITYGEFLRQYDGQYAEYVDGEILEPFLVSERHNNLTIFLSSLLTIFTQTRNLGRICGEPYQMKILIDDKIKGREPDIFFVKTENFDRIGEQFFDGAADLVIEVVSRESVVRDTQEKFEEYETVGVEEYWVIDPNRRTANFYNLDENGKYKLRYPSAEDVFESRVIEGLWIKTDWLWQDELPNLMDVLKGWKLV